MKLQLRRILMTLMVSLLWMAGFAQKTVSGTVLDEQGEPIIGASVQAGKGVGSVTDLDGKFIIKGLGNDATLKISYVGYATQTVSVAGKSSITVTLVEEDTRLNDVVVIGYGSMRKKDLTGSVTQIKPSKIMNEHPQTVEDLLRGNAGLDVGVSNSAKGNASFRVRGDRSLYTDGGHNSPLIVLDGMIFYGELSEINPEDIGQIDVLKDASSAAIYGAKSASGVIIITTKKGSLGKPKINLTANASAVTLGANQKPYNAQSYLKFRQDWFESKDNYSHPGMFAEPTTANLSKYGITIDQWREYAPSSNSDTENWLGRIGLFPQEIENYLARKSYDWYDKAYRTGFSQDYTVSLSGASERFNYYMSAGYQNNQSLFKGDDYKAYRVNLKMEGKVNNWLTLGANVNFQDRSSGGLVMEAETSYINNTPYALPTDSEGNHVYRPMGNNGLNNGYNYDYIKQFYDSENGATVLNSIFNAKVTLPYNITYSFNIAPRYTFGYSRSFNSSEHPEAKYNGEVDRSQSKNFDWSLNNTINWDYTFADKHHFNVTLSQEAEEFRYWNDEISAKNFEPSDALGFHNTSNASKDMSAFNSTDTHTTASALLARLYYGYDDRYMITASVRRDGYSAFGISNPYATFPAVALAWGFTNEKFFTWEAMSMGKLRFSWGKNGNRSLSDTYLALSNLSALYADGSTKTEIYMKNDGSLIEKQQLVVSRLANPNLQWEKTSSWNVGLDFGFLDNRIMGSIDYYVMPTNDMIMWQTLPNFTGFSSVISNLGEVENRGLELTLNTINIKNSTLEWTTNLNLSFNRNKIKHLYYEYEDVLDANGNIVGTKEQDVVSNNWFIGQDASVIWNYVLDGIWQEAEAEQAALYGQRPGDPKIRDSYEPEKHEYTDEDKEFQGSTKPKFQWSMRNTFTLWKSLELTMNLYSKIGGHATSTVYQNNMGYMSEWTNSIERNYWTPENKSNEYARLSSIMPKNAENAPKVINNSFIRLENISVGYTFKDKWIKKYGLEKLKVYGSVRNAAVWMKERENRWDPEYGGAVPRTFNIGVNATF